MKADRDRTERKKPKFRYQAPSDDDIKQRAEQTGGGFDRWYQSGFTLAKIPEGDNTVRFLPPTYDVGVHYGIDIYIHHRVGPDNSDYLCLFKMKKEECPICETMKKIIADGDEEEGKKWKASQKVLAWILDRNKGDFKPLLWPQPWTFDRDLCSLSQGKKGRGSIPIADPEVGYDVYFRRTGTKLNTRYAPIEIDREPSAIADDTKTFNEIIDYIEANPLPKVLKYYDAEYLDKILSGTVEHDEMEQEESRPVRRVTSKRREEEEEEEEERPAKRRVADEEEERPSRRRAAPRDEEEEEEEEPPFEPDEEEDDEDQPEGDEGGEDEGDEPEEEEEAIEAPRRRRRATGGTSGKIIKRRR